MKMTEWREGDGHGVGTDQSGDLDEGFEPPLTRRAKCTVVLIFPDGLEQ